MAEVPDIYNFKPFLADLDAKMKQRLAAMTPAKAVAILEEVTDLIESMPDTTGTNFSLCGDLDTVIQWLKQQKEAGNGR